MLINKEVLDFKDVILHGCGEFVEASPWHALVINSVGSLFIQVLDHNT